MARERIAFTDFWPSFNARPSLLHEAIGKLGIVITNDPSEATTIIHSDFGRRHWVHDGRTIHFSGENVLPGFSSCDAAITSALLTHERHYRLPYWAFSCAEPERLTTARRDGSAHAASHSGFCSFVASNPRAPERNRVFRALHRRVPVDGGGRCFNTTGTPVADKRSFLATHRFNLGFENSSSHGYTTEKIVDAFLAGTIPIYWGNPEVGRDFNPRSFINAQDFHDVESLTDEVARLWNDRDQCIEILSEPIFTTEAQRAPLDVERLCAALDRFLTMPLVQRPLKRTQRRLRTHCYRSHLHHSVVSFSCRIDALLWRLGWHR